MTSQVMLDSTTQARRRFLNGVLDVVGRSNVRAFYVPSSDEGLVARDEVIATRTWTHTNTPAQRITRQGDGYVVAYNGSTDQMTVPDADDLSFGDGTNDSPFSVVSMFRSTSITTAQTLLIKFAVTLEWGFQIISSVPRLLIRDESAAVAASRSADTALLSNRWYVVGSSYSDATGGATAANDMLQYVDGKVVASTATNNAGYVAMENLTHPVLMGAASMVGWMGFNLLVAGVISPAKMAEINDVASRFYRL